MSQPQENPTHNEALALLRQAIDLVDSQLLALLNERASLSLQVGEYKKVHALPVLCPARERELLQTLQNRNPGPLPAEHLVAIYREILCSSRLLQQ